MTAQEAAVFLLENKKNVKMLKEQGLGESAIAYRIWKKHPDILEKAISK